ncbi:pfkB carbohydrate kinase family protein [Rhodococcus sp. MTM3W5.2]|uniref:ribokinase n=1 Tax=Rhodococcus sp. MTM3W5.2 TaxID=1805827 RepID=UPI0009792745|nr:ribokinase [Rhodococcus sp. MTM3W5.2]AQA24708.1 pfkB carbohydrate kinase family protein [Rhodococcus sp. MTM3W5.2]
MSAPRITVLGSINMDLVTTTPRLPAPGETILGHGFSTGPGGKGSNQAIAAARAGAQVRFLGAVGDDAFAQELRSALVVAGVDATLLRETMGLSGVAVISVDDSGENSIVVVSGANAALCEPTDTELAAIADADLLLSQLELPLAAVTAGARHARANGTTVILNPSPAAPLPDQLIACVDVLVVNETEAAQLGAATLALVPDVVTTLGARGATLRGPGGLQLRSEPPAVEVVDTTGAGDAFAGTLAASWHLGREVALARACAAGALATTRAGAGSAPTHAEVDAALGRQ